MPTRCSLQPQAVTARDDDQCCSLPCRLRVFPDGRRECALVRESGRLLARIHEARGSILVYARVRPPTAEEAATPEVKDVVDILSDSELSLYDEGKR